MDESVSRMFVDIVECFAAPCVCQCVECCDLPVWVMFECVAHEVTADNPRAAGHQYLRHTHIIPYYRVLNLCALIFECVGFFVLR